MNAAREPTGRRPILAASYGSTSLHVAPFVAERLLARGIRDFHIDCLCVDPGAAAAVRTTIREMGLVGYVTAVPGPLPTPESRPKAEYDVHWIWNSFLEADDVGAWLDGIRDLMTPVSSLIVCESSGALATRSEERERLTERLLSRLLPRHRSSRKEQQEASAPAGDLPRQRSLLDLLAARFAFAELLGFGGVSDAFVDASSGIALDLARPEDRRFLDYVFELERRVRASETYPPTRFVARLRRADGGAPKVEPPKARKGGKRRNSAAVRVDFEFADVEEIFEHRFSGTGDEDVLGEGFHAWEPENLARWTERSFSLRLALPTALDTYRCRVVIGSVDPSTRPKGAARFFVNGVPGPIIENVYALLVKSPELALEFSTRGGSVTLTCVLDAVQKPPDAHDSRELGILIHSVKAYGLWRR